MSDLMRTLVATFPAQWRDAMSLSADLSLPRSYRKADHLIVAGMGGSGMGGDLLRDLLRDDARGPIIVNRSYDLPGWVDASTLVCAVSYSGNTEETLSVYRLAKARHAKMCCVTSGGRLAALAKKDGVPLVMIPSGYPPRAALSYTFLPLVRIALLAGWDDSLWRQAEETSRRLVQWSSSHERGATGRLMTQWAKEWAGAPVLLVVPEDRRSPGFRWKNQLNENAKMLAYVVTLPEMDHNEVVGWGQPVQGHAKRWAQLSLRDRHDDRRMTKRFEVTQALWKRAKGKYFDVWAEGTSRMARFISHVHFGDWMSVYMAEQQHVKAMPVLPIDWLKKEMRPKRPSRPVRPVK